MKIQIERLSPHQNGKVFGVLFAMGSLVFLVPIALISMAAAPNGSTLPLFVFLLFPIIYLVLGYVMVAVSCWLYNVMHRHIGGIEFDAKSTAANE
jgi:hypothetical protein